MERVLITCLMEDFFLSGLEKLGFEVEYKPGIDVEEVDQIISGYSGLVLSTKTPVNRTLIDKATHLKFIARSGSGMEHIDVEYANSKGIHCISSPEGNCNAVGDHALGMLLSLLNNIHSADREVKSGKWERELNRGLELSGLTVGVIGYGHTGTAFSQRLLGFDVEVIAYDKYKFGYSNAFVKEGEMMELFEKCDIVSLHLPMTHETKNLVNTDWIKRFNKAFYLINTSRGRVVSLNDLEQALQVGKIRGACLDVLENEPPENSDKTIKKLIKRKNVILTPHIAGWSHQSKHKLGEVLLNKIHFLLHYS
jgi:D-3-phosphoglycerate dehydrogenase / 2-oxoglutarate reductase